MMEDMALISMKNYDGALTAAKEMSGNYASMTSAELESRIRSIKTQKPEVVGEFKPNDNELITHSAPEGKVFSSVKIDTQHMYDASSTHTGAENVLSNVSYIDDSGRSVGTMPSMDARNFSINGSPKNTDVANEAYLDISMSRACYSNSKVVFDDSYICDSFIPALAELNKMVHVEFISLSELDAYTLLGLDAKGELSALDYKSIV